MNNMILILEPSKTFREFLKEKLKGLKDVALAFVSDGFSLLESLRRGGCSAVMINARTENPGALELAVFLKSVDGFKDIPLAFYSSSDFALKDFYLQRSRAALFFDIRESGIDEKVQNFLSGKWRSEKSFIDSSSKEALLIEVFESVRNLQSIKEMAKAILECLARLCELPAAGIILRENEGIKEYFLCSENFSESEERDFFKVCADDFKSQMLDAQGEKIDSEKIADDAGLNAFHKNQTPLSSYQSAPLLDGAGNSLGSLCVVKEGNVTEEETALIAFCAARGGLPFECALLMQKKLYFERRIRKAFCRFVPEQIIDDLVEQADSGGKVAVGEKRNVAILFSDIRSFTNISERNKPETIVAFLNRYFTIMVNVIKKHGGTIDKFIGDAIMALFGAPVSYEDNCRRAVAAAYEMREALSSVPMEDLVMPEGMKFNIGIGIHYGDVIVGSIGSEDKTDYSVIGDSVNLASRLEGLTKTYGAMVVVSDSVKNDIGESGFVFRYLDDVKVKGKAQSVSIYAVDKSLDEFSPLFRDSYSKGMNLYKQGIWALASEYFQKALNECGDDKAALLMLERCKEFMESPPENWDGAITFKTK